MSRTDIITEFLSSQIKGKYNIEEIQGDASARKYSRILGKKGSFILMDSTQEKESLKQFIKVTKILEDIDIKPPKILAEDTNNGLLLLEDLGNDKLSLILSNQFYNEVEFYRNTVNLLIHIHKQTKDKKIDLPPYDEAVHMREAMLFLDWYLPMFEEKTKEDVENLRNEFSKNISSLYNSLSIENNSLVLRDFHADNLLYIDSEVGVKKIAVIDYQDALIGHPAYDLMSLLEDARRDVNKYIQEDMIKYFIFQIGEMDNKDQFISDYYTLAAIRNLKILGIFCRLKLRDKKDNYIELIPRVKSYLIKDLEHPNLKNLKDFIKKTCKTI